MRTPLRRSVAQVLKIARAGGRSLRQRIWSDAYRFPRGSAQDPGPITATLIWAGDMFLTVPYRPILPRLDCHAWLSVRRPERRQCARLRDRRIQFICAHTLVACTPVRIKDWLLLRAKRLERTWQAMGD
jgi:hypothetical protein